MVKNLRINEQIRVREVRLVDDKGEQRGILPIKEAMTLAQDASLDLVEVAPQAKPPVCKLMNFGKYKFEMEKKAREQKKNQKQQKLKEVRMQPKIEKHDLQFKAKHIQEFLDAEFKVKITIRFRGRELAHTDRGPMVFNNLMALLKEDTYTVETKPRMDGRFMFMMVAPKAAKKPQKPKDSPSGPEENKEEV